jgi:hypothetical protein
MFEINFLIPGYRAKKLDSIWVASATETVACSATSDGPAP